MELSITERRKNFKRNRLLSLIKSGENLSRSDLKNTSGYSMTTVLALTESMVVDGLIFEEDGENTGVGRKPVWLRRNPDGKYFIGVDFNASFVHCVVINFSGEVVHDKSVRNRENITADELIQRIKTIIHEALDFLGDKEDKLVGIGVGVPGTVDRERGISIKYSNIESWRNIPIKAILEEEFDRRVVMDNNVNAMAIAYKWLRYEGTTQDFVLVAIRYGVKMSTIIDNRIFCGTGGNAGEIMHVHSRGSSRLCSCGKRGCLGTEVSFRGIKSKVIEGFLCGRFKDIHEKVGDDFHGITEEMLVESYYAGSEDTVALFEDTAMRLAEALQMVVATLDPNKIILTGKLMTKDFARAVREALESLLPAFDAKVSVLKFDEKTGAIGAALLVMDEEFGVLDYDI